MGRAGRARGGEDESGAELAVLDPKALLAESGYTPG